MRLRSERHGLGSISLFLALILLALIACEWLLIRGARQRDDELRVRALAAHEADRQLAAYDSRLFENYGLLAVSEAKLPPIPGPWATREMAAIGGQFALERKLTAPLADPEVLDAQIRAYMEPLYPELLRGSLFTDMLTVFRGLKDFRSLGEESVSEFGGLADFAALMSSDVIQSLWLGVRDWGLRFLNREAEPQPTEPADTADAVDMGEETLMTTGEALTESESAEASDLLTRIFSAQGHSGTIAELGVDPEACGGSSFASAAALLERSLESVRGAGELIPGRLLLASYGLHMFSHWPHIHGAKDYPVERNLRGKKLRNLELENRLEVEHLAFGSDNQAVARASSFASLLGIRLALNTVSDLLSPTQMAKHGRRARILSLAIMVASAGEVSLEPELLRYVLLFVEAQLEALADTVKLVRGQAVKLLPHQSQFGIATHYSDYMYLFLLAVPEASLLQRIAGRIETNLGRSFHTTLSLELHWLDPRRSGGAIRMREERRCHERR